VPRPVCVYHSTSEPFRFFGRERELALLDDALHGGRPSVVAFVGPGGQGKTAIIQHWLERLQREPALDGIFLWSFYRGKDADLFLRELYAYAEGLAHAPEVSATYCVDHLLPILRRERWALILDGAEVAQHEQGRWFGRFVHPELGRLLEELARTPLPGVVVLTTRFPLPELERRPQLQLISLASLDPASAHELLRSVGVHGTEAELDEAAEFCGRHAKAVELLGTYLVRFGAGQASHHRDLPMPPLLPRATDEEQRVARVLAAHRAALDPEARDILALATNFRDPPTEERLRAYLLSPSVDSLLHKSWERDYPPFTERPAGWLAEEVQCLIDLRLLERVGSGWTSHHEPHAVVIDAHPLVRRGFENVLGTGGRRQSAQARAGFLRGRPDRRRPETLEEVREEVELFHAYCDAGLWNEADSTYVALENPKHRFPAPVLERDLLLRFFPEGDFRRPPLWEGFGRYRSLAICFELLGDFEAALETYPETDAPLRGDALLALGHLEPLLTRPQARPPWNTLWQAYRTHALCLAARTTEAVALARGLAPVDVYEWLHVFECLLRAGQLAAVDLRSLLYRPPSAAEQRWSDLARQRMRADYLRIQGPAPDEDLPKLYAELLNAYDRTGLPFERALARLGYARWLTAHHHPEEARALNALTLDLAQRHHMRIIEADAWGVEEAIADQFGDSDAVIEAHLEVARLRALACYYGPSRP
jgi:hypothetical protein